MKRTLANLSEAGKDELAVALILWKDFKSDGKMNLDVTRQFYEFSVMLGIEKNAGKMMAKLPPVKIVPRG